MHIKIYKSHRIYGEIVVPEGVVHIRCRECFRWYKLTIRPKDRPVLEESDPPDGSVEPDNRP